MSFFVMGITKVNKDFFTRVAPIRSLYTVVGFQFKFTKNPFQSKEELSKEEPVVSDVSAQHKSFEISTTNGQTVISARIKS